MKTKAYISLSILFLLILLFADCKKHDPVEEDFPIYSTYEDIVNPPDVFEVIYKLRTYGDVEARIKFDTNAVWYIEKVNALSSILWIERQYADSIAQFIINSDTLIGLEGNVFYSFFANNNNYFEDRNLFVMYTKKTIPYEDFLPKF